jgi:hypothetical protein
MRYRLCNLRPIRGFGGAVRKNQPERFRDELRGYSALRVVRFTVVSVLLFQASAAAQGTSTASIDVSLAQTLTELTRVIGVTEVGQSLSFNTALEVASAPLGTSAGGFAFKLDPTTGLEVRQATTFGPSFAERVMTSGAGKMSMSASVTAATYDNLGKRDLDQMELIHQHSNNPALDQSGVMSLVLNSETIAIQGVMGATEKLDVGVVVPIVRVRLDAISFVQDANGVVLFRATGKGSSSGLGDIAVHGKYRLLKFGGEPPPDAPVEPDPGGFAVQVVARLPTGSRENLRGLGIHRVLSSLIFSSGKGKLRPHGQIGYEWWSKGIDVESFGDEPTVTARNSFHYTAGIEFAAAPTLTLIVDFIGRQVNGGGKVNPDLRTIPVTNVPGVDALSYAFAVPEGILKQSIVPGLKWNLKGKFLLSLNGVIAVRDNGLYDKFTPVVGLDWTF